MANMYPEDKHYRPYPSEHLAVCIDPAYHEQYHGGGHPVHHKCKCDNGSGLDYNNDDRDLIEIEDEYDGLPRYDRPHPDPNACGSHHCHHRHERALIRDEEVGNIIRVKSKIIESLAVTLYSNIANRDVYIEMKIGTKYGIKWIGERGVQTCRGILTDFKASQRSTIYQPVNADGYYIVLDCSIPGRSDIKRILIASIRDIIEIDQGDIIIVDENGRVDGGRHKKEIEDPECVIVIDDNHHHRHHHHDDAQEIDSDPVDQQDPIPTDTTDPEDEGDEVIVISDDSDPDQTESDDWNAQEVVMID